jgi:hypothetical protein
LSPQFQNNCIINIKNDKNKQTYVFVVKGSSNTFQLNNVNTIAPILNPINLDGHISPLNAVTIFFTEYINKIEIGIPANTVNQ